MIGKLVLLALAIGKRNANNFYGMGGTAGLHYLLLLRIILLKNFCLIAAYIMEGMNCSFINALTSSAFLPTPL